MANPWYTFPVCVPFGNPLFDAGLGGSHDCDVAAPPNAPVTLLRSGTITDLSSPSWGKQVCLKLDSPVNGIDYMAYLHLSAINPSVHLGDHVSAGDVIGWVGGANSASQYEGTTNPTGVNFLNSSLMSSRIQVGIALMRGPVYGEGAGWAQFPPIDPQLNPSALLAEAISAWKQNAQDWIGKAAEDTWNAAKAWSGGPPPTDTNLYASYIAEYRAGRNHGVPLFGFASHDWNGNPIVVMILTNGRAEDNNGVIRWI